MLKKIYTILILLSAISVACTAQSVSSSVSQTIRLELSAAIEITSLTPAPVDIKFDNTSNVSNGVQQGNMKFNIRSNKEFMVSVNTDADYFSYSGPNTNNKAMPVNKTLFMEVADNQTGGRSSGEFKNYNSLTSTSQNLITNGSNGSDKTFAVNYKAKQDMNYASGQYMVGVVYTATQP